MLSLEPPSIVDVKIASNYSFALTTRKFWMVKFPTSSIEINDTVVYFKNPVVLMCGTNLYMNISHPHTDTDGFIFEKTRYFRTCYGTLSIRKHDESPNVVVLYNLINAMNGGHDRYYLPTDVTKSSLKETRDAYENNKVCAVCKLDLRYQFNKSYEYTHKEEIKNEKKFRLCRHCSYGSYVRVNNNEGKLGVARLVDVAELHGPESIYLNDYNFSCDKPVSAAYMCTTF